MEMEEEAAVVVPAGAGAGEGDVCGAGVGEGSAPATGFSGMFGGGAGVVGGPGVAGGPGVNGGAGCPGGLKLKVSPGLHVAGGMVGLWECRHVSQMTPNSEAGKTWEDRTKEYMIPVKPPQSPVALLQAPGDPRVNLSMPRVPMAQSSRMGVLRTASPLM
jgi:hypothetical protein